MVSNPLRQPRDAAEVAVFEPVPASSPAGGPQDARSSQERSFAPLPDYLRDEGVIGVPESALVTAIDELIGRYRWWLVGTES